MYRLIGVVAVGVVKRVWGDALTTFCRSSRPSYMRLVDQYSFKGVPAFLNKIMAATNANSYHAEDGETPSTAVVSAVAAYSGRSMLELPALYDSIDVDALDSLFHSWNGEDDRQHLSFTYADYQVTVYSSGTVDVQQAK